jgi:hypothetical protein
MARTTGRREEEPVLADEATGAGDGHETIDDAGTASEPRRSAVS